MALNNLFTMRKCDHDGQKSIRAWNWERAAKRGTFGESKMLYTALAANLHVWIASIGGLFFVENGFFVVGPSAEHLALACNGRENYQKREQSMGKHSGSEVIYFVRVMSMFDHEHGIGLLEDLKSNEPWHWTEIEMAMWF